MAKGNKKLGMRVVYKRPANEVLKKPSSVYKRPAGVKKIKSSAKALAYSKVYHAERKKQMVGNKPTNNNFAAAKEKAQIKARAASNSL